MHTMTTCVHARGADIPALGFGTSPMTGQLCRDLVSHALSVGYRHFDTSSRSGNEPDVGHAILHSKVPRKDVFVTTKVWREELRDGALQRSAQASLERLGLDCIDLLLVHWPNDDIPLAETMRALASARAQGLARHVGVANFPAAMFLRASELCSAPIVANQCEYHPLLDQDAVLAAVRSTGAAFISFSPLGRGGNIRSDALTAIAKRHGKTESQVLLRWNIQQAQVCAIPRSTNPARIAENFAVFDFALSDDEMARVSALRRSDGRQVNPPFSPQWDAAPSAMPLAQV